MKAIDLMDRKNWFDKNGERYRYFSPEGRGYDDVLDWAKDFEPGKQKNLASYLKYRIVKQDLVNPFFVSTVWLGLDHQYNPEMPPLIYESMVFGNQRKEMEQRRYTTREQAEAGHKELVKKYTFPRVLWTLLCHTVESITWDWSWKYHRFKRNMKGLYDRRIAPIFKRR